MAIDLSTMNALVGKVIAAAEEPLGEQPMEVVAAVFRAAADAAEATISANNMMSVRAEAQTFWRRKQR